MPEPSEQNGVHGFHKIPHIGSSKLIVSGRSINQALDQPDTSWTRKDPKAERMELKEWGEEDFKRLPFIDTDFFDLTLEEKIHLASTHSKPEALKKAKQKADEKYEFSLWEDKH